MAPTPPPSEGDISFFHAVVKEGDLEDLRTILESGIAVNAPGERGETALIVAVEAMDLEKAQLLVSFGADPDVISRDGTTALSLAVLYDWVEGARWLLGLGVDRGCMPHKPIKPLRMEIPLDELSMPDELRGTLSEDDWRTMMRDRQAAARNRYLNGLPARPIIKDVYSVAMLRLFLEAGDDAGLAPPEVRREWMGLETGGTLRASVPEYRQHKFPRFGQGNPEPMNYPFWKDMIRIGCDAYRARTHFGDPSPFQAPGAIWCYDRFGSSITPLPDGRFVQIGGEHEDHYDPDFHIYNDVVVHDGRGDCQIYGYPDDVFPPTDFHTATLVGDAIYIIGCLGYTNYRRIGFTPVARLRLSSWRMESVTTTGEMPGWIYKHHARYDIDRGVIQVTGGEVYALGRDDEPEPIPNPASYELELSSGHWRRLA